MQKLVRLHKKQSDLFIQLLFMVDKIKKHNGECGHLLTMSISGIFNRYTQYLRGAKRSGLKKEIVTAISMGIYFTILFGISGLAYW